MAQNALGGLGAYTAGLRLSPAQKTKIANLLGAKLGNRACEMCGVVSWAIGDNIVQPMPLQINSHTRTYTQDFTAVNPSIHLVCTNCGNTKMFLLTQLGFDPFA